MKSFKEMLLEGVTGSSVLDNFDVIADSVKKSRKTWEVYMTDKKDVERLFKLGDKHGVSIKDRGRGKFHVRQKIDKPFS